MVIGDLKESEDDAKMVPPRTRPSTRSRRWTSTTPTARRSPRSIPSSKTAGEVKGVAIEYGGFLGFGEKGAVVTFDQVKAQDGKLVTDLTEEQLTTLPAWNK